MLQAFQAISNAVLDPSGLNNPNAAKLCDSSLWSSMDLDQIILACVFTFMESFCADPGSPERFETFIDSIEWKLPTVLSFFKLDSRLYKTFTKLDAFTKHGRLFSTGPPLLPLLLPSPSRVR